MPAVEWKRSFVVQLKKAPKTRMTSFRKQVIEFIAAQRGQRCLIELLEERFGWKRARANIFRLGEMGWVELHANPYIELAGQVLNCNVKKKRERRTRAKR